MEKSREPEFASSAAKHGVRRADSLHAFNHPIRVFELDEGLTMLIGPAHSGQLLEVGVVNRTASPLVVHVMPARAKFLR